MNINRESSGYVVIGMKTKIFIKTTFTLGYFSSEKFNIMQHNVYQTYSMYLLFWILKIQFLSRATEIEENMAEFQIILLI